MYAWIVNGIFLTKTKFYIFFIIKKGYFTKVTKSMEKI